MTPAHRRQISRFFQRIPSTLSDNAAHPSDSNQICHNSKGDIVNKLCLGLVLFYAHTPINAGEYPEERALQRYRQWQAELQRLHSVSEALQVEQINRYVNRALDFVNDMTQWQRDDFWATPRESLERGAGDCEDFAILKYFGLRHLGLAPEKLWLVYAKLRIGGQQSAVRQEHMVLAYYPTPGADPLILDNLTTRLYPASERPDLIPVFSFNNSGVRIGTQRYPNTRLPPWNSLLERMERQIE